MSDMKIRVISVDVTNRGKFDQAEVTFKNLSFQEKVEAKKVMSFVNKDVFETLKSAKSGDEFIIKREKDDKGYWQWVGISAGGSSPAANGGSPAKTAATPAPKSTYETAEERAKRQVYIIRQSSISNAIEMLKTDKKSPSVEEVLGVAKVFEDYVFGLNLDADNPNVQSVPEFDPDEDIPL